MFLTGIALVYPFAYLKTRGFYRNNLSLRCNVILKSDGKCMLWETESITIISKKDRRTPEPYNLEDKYGPDLITTYNTFKIYNYP